MATMARIGGTLYLPYTDEDGNDIPIESGEVIYKMSALSVDGELVRVPATVVAEIKHGVLQTKSLTFGVWTADIRPTSPVAYAKRIRFLADKAEMDLSDVIPLHIEGMDVVRGEDGAHVVGVEAVEGDIIITMSTGNEFRFALPHAALDEGDRAILDRALESIVAGEQSINAMVSSLRADVEAASSSLQGDLQTVAEGVTSVTQSREAIAGDLTEAERAAGEASTSAQNALGYSQAAHTHSQSAQQALEDLRTGIANGDFKGEDGQPGTTTWAGITDKPDLSAFVSSTNIDGIVTLTQAEYDALTPSERTLYVIREA